MAHDRVQQRSTSRRTRLVSLAVVAALTAAILSMQSMPMKAAAAAEPQPAGGVLMGWGRLGGYGEPFIDYGSTPTALTPLPGGVQIAKASGLDSYAVALGSDGHVYTWGANPYGQLGTLTGYGTSDLQPNPAKVGLPGGITATEVEATPGNQSLALGSDSVAYMWGMAGSCQPYNQVSPVALPLPAGIHARQVTGGETATYILGDDGNIYAAGENQHGELGTGSMKAWDCAPAKVSLPAGVTATFVAAGAYYALAVGSDGRVYTWGESASGELGTGAAADAFTPVAVQLPAGVSPVDISAGWSFVLMTGSDGQLYAWGNNYVGQIGDGTTTDATTPVAVALPAGVRAASISARGTAAFAIGSDGHLYGWGGNSEGGVGDGTTTDAHTPVRVHVPAGDVRAVFAGFRFTLAVIGTVAPTFTQASPPSVATAGAALDYTFIASGFPEPTYALAAGAPSWLSIDSSSGKMTGTLPDDARTFSFSVTATNSVATTTAGPFAVTMPARPVDVSGTVIDANGAPVADALVDVCLLGGSVCQHAPTDAAGAFDTTMPPDSTVVVTAYPPVDSRLTTGSIGQIQVGPAGLTGVAVTLPGSTELPGVIVTSGQVSTASGGQPVLHWSQETTVQVAGCPNGTGMTTLVGLNNRTGEYEFHAYPLTEKAEGSGIYAGTIPPQFPVHGPVNIQQTVICPGQFGVQPQSGLLGGGESVVISGTGLTGASAVLFGSTPATDLQAASDDLLTVTAPAGSGMVPVLVTRAGGATSQVGTYTYVAAGDVPGLDLESYGKATAGAGPPPSGSTPVAGHALAGTSPERSAFVASALLTDTSAEESSALATGAKWIYNHFPGPQAATLRSAVATVMAGLHPSCETDRAALKAAVHLGVAAAVATLMAAISPVMIRGTLGVLLLTVTPIVAILLTPLVYWLVKVTLSLIINKIVDALIDAAIDAALGPCPDHRTNTLIDPSGTVLDTNGNPISGATVTILRADAVVGPFVPVDTSQPGVEPTTNPETTAADGVFHWDVRSGFYEVQASKPDCTVPGRADQDVATVGPMPVPPPQIGLTITLACPRQDPPPTPAVTGLTATTGPPGGGTTLVISGSGFTPAATVAVGGAPASRVTYLGTTGIEITTPAHVPGLADVVVQTPGGSSATGGTGAFTYGTAPAITGMSPSEGSTAGGTVVTITGSGFTGANMVGFGGSAGSDLTVDSDTHLTVTAPQMTAAGPVDVEVVTPIGANSTGPAVLFTYTTDTGGTSNSSAGKTDDTAPAGSDDQTSSSAPASTATAQPPADPTDSSTAGQRATVTLDESAVAAGDGVTVTGVGFAPGEAVRATLYSTPIDLGSQFADAQGRVRFTVTIPASLTPGIHHITLTGADTGRVATAALVITVVQVMTGHTARPALADTGVSVGVYLVWALLALLIGSILTVVTSRRESHRSRDRRIS